MSEQSVSDEFSALLRLISDGAATDGDRERLAMMLGSDMSLRSAYVEHCQMHALLRSEQGVLAASASDAYEFVPSHRRRSSLIFVLRLGASAAALILVCGLVWKSYRGSSPPYRGREIATLKTAVGAQFAFGARSDNQTLAGAAMPCGPYELQSGIVELEYESGVQLTIEAPAIFELVDEELFRLSDGRVAAHVPQRAIGFRVEAPAATVVDLGTDFAVDATADEDSEVHVFEGEVRVDLHGVKGELASPLRLLSGQATRIDFSTGMPAGIDIDEQRFMRSLRSRSLSYSRQVLALDPVVYYQMEPVSEGRTLLDASKSQVDADVVLGRATTPVWVAGKVGSALQLGGPAEETFAYATSYPQANGNQLSVVAWVYARSRPRWASIAKNWAGGDDRGQFHFGLLDDDGALEAHVADGNGGEIMVRDSEPLPLRRWHHVAMVADGATLRLYRNGRIVHSTPCTVLPRDARIRALAIGTKLNLQGTAPEERDFNMWDGRLDELAIFNHALSEDEISRLFEAATPHPDASP